MRRYTVSTGWCRREELLLCWSLILKDILQAASKTYDKISRRRSGLENCSLSGYTRSWVTASPVGTETAPHRSAVGSTVWDDLWSLLNAGKDISRGQPRSPSPNPATDISNSHFTASLSFAAPLKETWLFYNNSRIFQWGPGKENQLEDKVPFPTFIFQ